MTKCAFSKGQAVTVISVWDRRGTVYTRNAHVHSCGMKVLRLTCDDTGEEFGREYQPIVAVDAELGVRGRLEGDALNIVALKVSAAYIASEHARLDRCIEHYGPEAGAGYIASINRDKDALTDPRTNTYAEALAAL